MMQGRFDAMASDLRRNQSDTLYLLEMLERYAHGETGKRDSEDAGKEGKEEAKEEEGKDGNKDSEGKDEGKDENLSVRRHENRLRTPVGNVPDTTDTSPMLRTGSRHVGGGIRSELNSFRSELSQFRSQLTLRSSNRSPGPAATLACHLSSTPLRHPSNSNVHIVPQHYPLNPHYTIYNAANKLIKGEGEHQGRHMSVLMDPLQPIPDKESSPGAKGFPFALSRANSTDSKLMERTEPRLMGLRTHSLPTPETSSQFAPMVQRNLLTPLYKSSLHILPPLQKGLLLGNVIEKREGSPLLGMLLPSMGELDKLIKVEESERKRIKTD